MQNHLRSPDGADPNHGDEYDLEGASGAANHHGNPPVPGDQGSSGSLRIAGALLRALPRRMVDIISDGEAMDHQTQPERSYSPSVEGHHLSDLAPVITLHPSRVYGAPMDDFIVPEAAPLATHSSMPNLFNGRSLGVFGPENSIRLWLLDLLIHPWTEPLLLVLIILQAVLLAVQAAPNVWSEGNARPGRWGKTPIDWVIFAIFAVFTLEVIARIVVSRFIINAPEQRTIDRKQGICGTVIDKSRILFQPQHYKSNRRPHVEAYGSSDFPRSLTVPQKQRFPETLEGLQRMQLARRAFLRHTFNRLDFVAIVSFWISFVLGITGIEHAYHIYVFRMLSCLRILRLLPITSGNAIVLRSLMKAFPLLVRILALIGIFWLLFAIIGVQSFKVSLSRQCVWLDPTQPTNLSAAFTNQLWFCGGHLQNDTDPTPTTLPWVFMTRPGDLTSLNNGTSSGKGFICPRGSICLQQGNPYNGTVHFDDILHSLELAYVVMSANTFTDLMYYTMNSDGLPTALFFAGGIIVMVLWMTNSFIAVLISSFQVIREESKRSNFTADEKASTLSPANDRLRRMSTLQRIYNKTVWFWALIIAYDILVMALRTVTMKPDRTQLIDISEIIVTILLDIEIIIRVTADWRAFHRKLQNVVDLVLAIITSVILLPPIHDSGQAYAWLTGFQILRMYRIVLVVPITREMIRLTLGNAAGIGNLMLFVLLITFLVAILAAQLFRGEITQTDSQGNNIRVNFASVFNSFLGMYQILSSENWTTILYNVTGFTTAYRTSWIGAIFLIFWFTLSYFILMNMFIAVFLENFDVPEDQKRLEQVKAFLQTEKLGDLSSNLSLTAIFSIGQQRKQKEADFYGQTMNELLLKEAVVRDFFDEPMNPSSGPETVANQRLSQPPDSTIVKPSILSSVWSRTVRLFTSREPNPFYSNYRIPNPTEGFNSRQIAQQAITATAVRRKAQREYLLRHPTYNNALFVFIPRNPIRRMCQRLVGPGRGSERLDGVQPNKDAWYAFSAFIYASIVAMVIITCIVTPLYQKEYFEANTFSVWNWFVWTDVVFVIIFTLEALIKIVADGFFWTPHAYLRSSWGIIAAVVLITLWINVAILFANDGAVPQAVGVLKALRILRLLNISDNIRQMVRSFIVVARWKILGAVFISMSLLLPFAIYGVNLFRGQMVSCNDNTSGIVMLDDCSGEYNSSPFKGPNNPWNLVAPRVASNSYFNFDNFGSSLFILFQIVSQEGWVDASFAAQATTGIGMQPQIGASRGNALFFLVFNLLATVFILALFTSVLIWNWTELTGAAFLTAGQRSWVELRKRLKQISPDKGFYGTGSKRTKWYRMRTIKKRGKWYMAVTFVLMLHLILLTVEYSTEPDWWTKTRDCIFLAFTLLYMANIAIRIIGLGWSRFRRSPWDVFSLVPVTGAFVTSILILASPTQDTSIRIHKLFLVAIVFLLIPRNNTLDQALKTVAVSLMAIGALLATWLIIFVGFAIALTQAFSLTRFGRRENNNLNFRNVPNALILLFRMSFGEGWNQIMEDFASITPPLCVEDATIFEGDCGSPAWAYILFTLWNIISIYIFANLFLALVYESFSFVRWRSGPLDQDEITRFKVAWHSVDPVGTGFIKKEALRRLLVELIGVFEMRIYDREDSVQSILDDVRRGNRAAQEHRTPLASQSALAEVDLHKLNARLRRINVSKVRERRRHLNLFFEEMMVMADWDKGVSFTTVLTMLTLHNIVKDGQSLRLVEYLRRRARIQRAEEQIRRKIVIGFFDTLYWSRKFRRHMEMKNCARMTTIPQLGIPDIWVEDEEDRVARTQELRPAVPSPTTSSSLGADDAMSEASVEAGLHETSCARPLGMPRVGNTSGLSSLATHESAYRRETSASSFEAHELDSHPAERLRDNSRRGSAVDPAQVRQMLDDSAWMESIRRSAT